MQAGNVCCVLSGAAIQFILWKDVANYIFLGELYVHGVMRGEVLRMTDSEGVVEEGISIG